MLVNQNLRRSNKYSSIEKIKVSWFTSIKADSVYVYKDNTHTYKALINHYIWSSPGALRLYNLNVPLPLSFEIQYLKWKENICFWNLKLIPNVRILKNFSSNIFSYSCFDIWPGIWTVALHLISQHTTYLLVYIASSLNEFRID